MSRTAKIGVVFAGVSFAAMLLVAYRHRHGLVARLRRMEQSLTRGNSSAAAPGTLEIGGKKFKDVLGYPPYYLAVTQYDAVLFVTRVNDGGTNMFHIMNLKTGQEEQIQSRADFGRDIGATGGDFRDYIERAGPDEVVVVSEAMVGRRMKTVLHLKLAAAMVDTREVYCYDENGRITNTYEGPGF